MDVKDFEKDAKVNEQQQSKQPQKEGGCTGRTILFALLLLAAKGGAKACAKEFRKPSKLSDEQMQILIDQKKNGSPFSIKNAPLKLERDFLESKLPPAFSNPELDSTPCSLEDLIPPPKTPKLERDFLKSKEKSLPPAFSNPELDSMPCSLEDLIPPPKTPYLKN